MYLKSHMHLMHSLHVVCPELRSPRQLQYLRRVVAVMRHPPTLHHLTSCGRQGRQARCISGAWGVAVIVAQGWLRMQWVYGSLFGPGHHMCTVACFQPPLRLGVGPGHGSASPTSYSCHELCIGWYGATPPSPCPFSSSFLTSPLVLKQSPP